VFQFLKLFLILAFFLSPTVVTTQTLGGVRPQTTAPRKSGVLTAFRAALDISHLSGVAADNRYNWDADLLLDADLFDVGMFRGNLLANLETIVGSELRDVDPNQNNYTADFSIFVRLPRGELGTTFHHVSRHLSDRKDLGSVSWNMVGVSYGDRFTLGALRVDAGIRALGTVERAGVDYTAQLEWHGHFTRPINPRISIIAGLEGVIVPVEKQMMMRNLKKGGVAFGGVRFPTGVGVIDVYVAWERRIDAGQFSRDIPQWTKSGIRLRTPLP